MEVPMFFCGIDVAKRNHVALIMHSTGTITHRAFTIANTHDGLAQLHQHLQALTEPVTIGLEATGHYWLALYEFLAHQGYAVIVLNPLQIHAYRQSGVRKCKNNRTDAFWIADFIRIGNGQVAVPAMAAILQVRALSRFRFHVTEQIGNCKRKVIAVLDRVFPEYETLFSSVFLASSRRLLMETVTAQEFAELDLTELTQVLQSSSRGRFGVTKATAVQTLARQSVGVRFLTDAVHVEMRCLLEQITLLETQRDQIDTALEALMMQVPSFITTIPGIGLATGAAILAEIGDIRRFDAPEKLVAYAGIDASVYQTGEFTADHAHMSKRGSPYLRQALWQAAMAAILHDPELRTYYQHKRAEGKHHGTVLGAVCRKLLTRIYIVLKEQRPYQVRPVH
jgi:transposase